MLRSHHLCLYSNTQRKNITDNKLVVFLTSLHCTFTDKYTCMTYAGHKMDNTEQANWWKWSFKPQLYSSF